MFSENCTKKVTTSQDDGFVRGLKYSWLDAENTKRSKKSQALRMTALSGGLKTAGWICRKHQKIEKVTSSQDDVFVGVLKKNIPN
jgi:hypothetical protein